MSKLDQLLARLTRLEEQIRHDTVQHTDEEMITIHEDRNAVDTTQRATKTATVATRAKARKRRRRVYAPRR